MVKSSDLRPAPERTGGWSFKSLRWILFTVRVYLSSVTFAHIVPAAGQVSADCPQNPRAEIKTSIRRSVLVVLFIQTLSVDLCFPVFPDGYNGKV